MGTTVRKIGTNWHILWQWCLASTGAILAIILVILVGSQLPSPLGDWELGWILEPYLVRFATGAVVGISQWIVLRTHVPRAGWWNLATAVAWVPAWARLEDMLPISLATEYAVIAVATGAVAGGLAGLGPWLVLQRHRGRVWWLLALPAAAGASAGLTLAVAPLLRRTVMGPLERLVAQADIWGLLGVGAATGVAWGAGIVLAARHLVPARMVFAAASGVVATAFGWLLAWTLWSAENSLASYFGLQGLVVGTLTGLAQWLVLWRRVPRSGWWIAASAAGWMVGLALQEAILDRLQYGYSSPLSSTFVQLGILLLPPMLFSAVAITLLLARAPRTAAAAAPAFSHPVE